MFNEMMMMGSAVHWNNIHKQSCETQLLEFVDDVSSNMSSWKQTDLLVMDF
jgi:hypothetical protein